MRVRAMALTTVAFISATAPLTAQAPVASPRTAAAAAGSTVPGILREHMDSAVRPQDDFFRHVNGTWLRRGVIPPERRWYGAVAEVRAAGERAVRAILEDAGAGRLTGDPDADKIGAYYRAYLDSGRADRLGLVPLRPELDRIARLRHRSELPELVAHLQRLGVETPFWMNVSQDLKNPTQYVAWIGQGGLGLPDREYYSDTSRSMADARVAYARYAETLLRHAGWHDARSAAAAVLALEGRLAARQWDRARARDVLATYTPLRLVQLDSMSPAFSWTRYAGAVGITVSPHVVVQQPDYLQALGRIIAETAEDTWRAYFTVHLVDAHAEALSAPFVAARFAYRGRALQGLEADRPRWQRAVAATEAALGEAVGRVYVQRHLPPEAKARIDQLVRNVVDAFGPGLDELAWMTPETKARAREKLAKLTVKIGYPAKWRDYAPLDVQAADLIGNLQRARAFEFDYWLRHLGRPIDRDEWFTPPQTVNAFYNASLNEIVFPAGALQPPFFDARADDAVNYGAIGSLIGHEIGHAFDDQGRRTDGDGALRDWWTAADAKSYEALADRLVAQYDTLSPVPGARVNGRLTLGENIGDLSGVAMAHRAYRRALGGRDAPVLGGLTGDQRFFIGYAQSQRAKFRENALREILVTDPHAPFQYRVNQVLKNVPAFHAAFGVRPGDGMYLPPEARVRIW